MDEDIRPSDAVEGLSSNARLPSSSDCDCSFGSTFEYPTLPLRKNDGQRYTDDAAMALSFRISFFILSCMSSGLLLSAIAIRARSSLPSGASFFSATAAPSAATALLLSRPSDSWSVRASWMSLPMWMFSAACAER